MPRQLVLLLLHKTSVEPGDYLAIPFQSINLIVFTCIFSSVERVLVISYRSQRPLGLGLKDVVGK
jgi:hypothetical protein